MIIGFIPEPSSQLQTQDILMSPMQGHPKSGLTAYFPPNAIAISAKFDSFITSRIDFPFPAKTQH